MTSYNFFAALLLATFVVSERQAFSIPIAKGVRGGKKSYDYGRNYSVRCDANDKAPQFTRTKCNGYWFGGWSWRWWQRCVSATSAYRFGQRL